MLTLENISFGVKDEKGEKEIIKNLNLSIGENKFVVIRTERRWKVHIGEINCRN